MRALLRSPVDILRGSEKFLAWEPPAPDLKTEMSADDPHYTPEELALAWNVSTEIIRSVFRDEPGVLKIGKTGSKYKRGYITLRIPEEVVERVHRRLSA